MSFLAALTLTPFITAVPADAQPLGALSPSDQDLIKKVRQAGLWEMPSGAMAIQRADSEQVKQVGRTLMVDHGRLELKNTQIAQQFGVPLPTQPTADQQSWLREEQNARNGAEFQQIFANRLRAAHGQVLSTIAAVRAGTKNDTMRAWAATLNQVVLRHITLLESTGMVDYGRLPEPAVNTTASTSAAQSLNIGAGGVLAVAGVTIVAGGGMWWLLRVIRRPKRRSAGARHVLPDPQPEA